MDSDGSSGSEFAYLLSNPQFLGVKKDGRADWY